MDLSALQEWDGQTFGADASSLPHWQALADILLTGKNTLRRTVTIKPGLQAKADYKEEFLAWLNAMPETDEWVEALADIRSAQRNRKRVVQGKRVAVSVDRGGRRRIKKTKN